MPPDPPRLRGQTAPCSYGRLFFSNQLPTSNFIETPALEICNLINVVMHEIQYAGLQATLQGSCLCLKLFLENPPRIFHIKYIATT